MAEEKLDDKIKTAEQAKIYFRLLTPHRQKVAEMCFFEDLSLAEAAEILGVNKQSVACAVNEIKKQLAFFEESLGLYEKKLRLLSLSGGLDAETAAEIADIIGE